jgi:hypothetical protein
LRKIFSRPVSSPISPAPTSINGATAARTEMLPFEGTVMRDSIFSSVLLPAPL